MTHEIYHLIEKNINSRHFRFTEILLEKYLVQIIKNIHNISLSAEKFISKLTVIMANVEKLGYISILYQ